MPKENNGYGKQVMMMAMECWMSSKVMKSHFSNVAKLLQDKRDIATNLDCLKKEFERRC